MQVETDIVPTTSVLGIHHATLVVSDLAAAEQFYRSTQLTVAEGEVFRQAGSNQPEKSVKLMAPNGCLELQQYAPSIAREPLPVVGPGITHACFQAPADQSLYQQLVAGGADPVSVGESPIDLNGAGVRYAYARDPDGSMFEVEELDQPKFTGPIWLAHIALVTPDIDRAVAFYQQLLGVKPYGRVNKIVGPKFDQVTGLSNVRIRAAWFNVGNMVLEFWEFVQPLTPAERVQKPIAQVGYGAFSIEVDDLDGEIARLDSEQLQLKATLLEGNGMRGVTLADPDGNLLHLVETTSKAQTRVLDFAMMPWLPAPAWPDSVVA
jgi:catechol 2,3-dioxygenase-like lactoylglutathione lyase family enzyme